MDKEATDWIRRVAGFVALILLISVVFLVVFRPPFREPPPLSNEHRKIKVPKGIKILDLRRVPVDE